MKNLFFATILFIAMLFTVNAGANKFNEISGELLSITNPLGESITNSNWEKADKLNLELNKYWRNKRKFLSTIIDHRDLESIDYEIIRLNEYLKNKVSEDSEATISSIEQIYETITKLEKVSLTNIF